MNEPDGKPTTPDDDFEPLAPALEPWFEKKLGELPAELQERITSDRGSAWLVILWDVSTPGQRRDMAQERDWRADPANKDAIEFSWDVGCRYGELKRREDELKVVPAVGMQAVAARNHEQRLIDGERIALKEDERDVRSTPPTELRETIERVRRRWDERALRSAGMSIMDQTQGLDGLLRAPAGVDAHPAEAQPRLVCPARRNLVERCSTSYRSSVPEGSERVL